jgi:hypothetical protein
MWGNRLGWIISAIMMLAFTGAMFAVQYGGSAASSMTDAFAADPANLQEVLLPVDPQSIVLMDEDCDAAELYRQAISDYEKNPDLYKDFDQEKLDQLAACTPIISAIHCRRFSLFEAHPEQVINFDREKSPIEALLQVGQALAKRAQYELRRGDATTSLREAQAVFSLGTRLYKERIVYEEFTAGLALMGDADAVMKSSAEKLGNIPLATQVGTFEKGRQQFVAAGGRIDQLHTITKNIAGETSAEHAGDVFALAQRSADRMWRIEACFQLGRMRFNIGDNGRAADQRHAAALLRHLADTDPDPIVKLAAAKARDMTSEEYQRE